LSGEITALEIAAGVVK